MITYDLSGKTALVTGSNRGIGKAMADALEEAGSKIVDGNLAKKTIKNGSRLSRF